MPISESQFTKKEQELYDKCIAAADALEGMYYELKKALPIHMRRDAKFFLIGRKQQKLFFDIQPGMFGFLQDRNIIAGVTFVFVDVDDHASLGMVPYNYES